MPVTLPAAQGPVRLRLSVRRLEESGEWQALLPLWPDDDDLFNKGYERVICYTSRKADDDGDIIEPDRANPEVLDSWEVLPGCTAILLG